MKRSVLLLISHTCNLKCKYCYEKFKDSRRMALNEAIEILEQEFSCKPDDITNVDLLGGEPLSNYSIIPQVCEWVWTRNPKMQIFIRTNGTLLSNEMKYWFSRHNNQVGLGLSIDGTPDTNYFNRGVEEVDIDFFKKYWPDVPVKVTIFPQSVATLFKSLIYLYEKGVQVTGGLAQGVEWDENACTVLSKEMEKLVDYYLSNPQITPLEPLFALDFDHAFDVKESNGISEKPCWERNIVHTYDCEKELLPCHLFSTIVQGQKKRSTILKEANSLKEDKVDIECQKCPIRWSCTNCMALNYQHFGDFGKNINKLYSCSAHKIAAFWSASLLTSLALQDRIDLSNQVKANAVRKAVQYLKTFEHGM